MTKTTRSGRQLRGCFTWWPGCTRQGSLTCGHDMRLARPENVRRGNRRCLWHLELEVGEGLRQENPDRNGDRLKSWKAP